LRCGRWETELRAVHDAWRRQIANRRRHGRVGPG
jgi:hypothetical protein